MKGSQEGGDFLRFARIGRRPEIIRPLHERRLALVAEFAEQIHYARHEVSEGTVRFESKGIEEVLLTEFGLLVERNGVEIREKAVQVLGVHRVELTLPKGVDEVAHFTFGDRFERDDRKRGIPASTVEV